MCEKARALIERLDTEPGSGQKLLGPLKGIRSARLGRSHRILYEISTDGSAHVLTIAPRKDAYR
ncbi:MAG: type II toxin-antitoxin system RelE/ParE family toxin [Candidatus Nanopelagicales bacterium]|nr:type II toxin-antitoxin system RelE/ParE family toxin [Candidatus Nanopelagicales bacterium]